MRKKVVVSYLLLLMILASLSITKTNNISTESKKFLSSNNDTVSTRELAMLASLVYEDVPNDNNYKEEYTKGCIKNDNKTIKNNCFFTSNGFATYKNTNYKVNKYIEGFSQRKSDTLISALLSATPEPGQRYYFYDFAYVSEMKNWEIYDYKKIKGSNISGDYPGWSNTFDAITFKKGNNYVIAYRGTDFADLYEWITDISYAFNGAVSQTNYAYDYAQEVYKKIEDNNALQNAKIYVTGHSLGAYLAQVGGAGIVDYEAGINNVKDKRNDDLTDLNKYAAIYAKDGSLAKNSHLEQVAYFNGMGVNALSFGWDLTLNSDTAINISNALVYLSTHDKNGVLVTDSTHKVNYSDEIDSSSRLVLYSMGTDPVSSIGLHFGEVYKLDVAADTIKNHLSHSISWIDVLGNAANGINNITNAGGLSSLFQALYNQIKNKTGNLMTIAQQEQAKQSVPSVVKNQVDDYYLLGTVDGISIIRNVVKNIGDYNNEYMGGNGDIMSVIAGWANANHETDSFICLMDGANGRPKNPEIDINVYNTNTCKKINGKYNCTSLSYNTKDNYSSYKYGDLFEKEKNKQAIVLTATVSNGCAKKYKWFISVNNNDEEWKELGSTINNEILIKSDDLNNYDLNDVDSINFKVEIEYGDSYKESKLVKTKTGNTPVISEMSYLTYEMKKDFPYNPTINDYEENDKPEKTKNYLSSTNSISIGNTTDSNKVKENQNDDISYNLSSNKIYCEKVGLSYVCYSNVSYSNVDDLELEFKNVVGETKVTYTKDIYESEKSYEELGYLDSSNKIIINNNIINSNENDTDEILFKVVDTNNNEKEFKIAFVFDTEAPVCYFDTSRVYKEIWKSGLFKYNPTSFTVKLLCEDNYGIKNVENIKVSTVYDSFIKDVFNQDATYKMGYASFEENNKRYTQNISFTVKKPISEGTKIYLRGNITDKASNEFVANGNMAPSFDIEVKKRR